MMLLGLILLSFVLTMLSNCVLAWTMHTLWDWFCVASLGPGPSNAGWWGIALISSVVIMCNTTNLARSETKKAQTWERPVSLVLSCLVTLGIAWVFGSILGWKE